MDRSAAAVASIQYEELEIEVGRCLCGGGEQRILNSQFDLIRESAFTLPVMPKI